MLSKLQTFEKQGLLQLERCPDCRSAERITDRDSGEIICGACGLVLNNLMLTTTPEWRAFTLAEKRAKKRVGAPIVYSQYDKGLSTTFQPYEGKLPLKTRLKMYRLKRWHIRAQLHSTVNRNLSRAMADLTRLADRLHIPRAVKEDAALIYRKALDKGLVRGRSIESIAAAALYAACRLTRTPRSLKAVVAVSPRSRKEIARCYRLLQRELAIKMPIDTPMKYVSKIASNLGLDQSLQNIAIKTLRKARRLRTTEGKGPAGIAAAALYIASIIEGGKVTQKELADAAGVTEVTVRNRYKGLSKNLDLNDISALESKSSREY